MGPLNSSFSSSPPVDSQQTNSITCSSATTFTVAGGSHSTSNLQCNSQITGDYVATGTRCGNGYGSLINLGFSTTLGFTTYIASCYDMVTGSVRYTKHPLPGAAIDCEYSGEEFIPSRKYNRIPSRYRYRNESSVIQVQRHCVSRQPSHVLHSGLTKDQTDGTPWISHIGRSVPLEHLLLGPWSFGSRW